MDFWDLTKLLARRWLIAVPMLMLSAVLTVLTVGSVQPDYVAKAYVQLMAPVEGAVRPGQAGPAQRNPWLGQGLQTVGNAAIIMVLDKTVVDELGAAGLSDSYTVVMGATSPMVTFEVVGDSEQQARETTERLVERFEQSVVKLQADDVTTNDAITTRRLDLGTNVEESNSKVKRALVAVAGAGMLMTIAVTVGVDALLLRRRRRTPAPAPAPERASLISAQVRRPGPAVAEAAGAPRSGVSAPAEADQTARIFRAKSVGSPPSSGVSAPAEADQTAKIFRAKGAESPPAPVPAPSTEAAATAPTMVVDYQAPAGVPKPAAPRDADQPAGSPLELTADATIVLPRSLPAKGDWPGRNGEKTKQP